MYEITDNERSVRSITNNSAGFVNRILRRVNSLLPKVSGGGGLYNHIFSITFKNNSTIFLILKILSPFSLS